MKVFWKMCCLDKPLDIYLIKMDIYLILINHAFNFSDELHLPLINEILRKTFENNTIKLFSDIKSVIIFYPI